MAGRGAEQQPRVGAGAACSGVASRKGDAGTAQQRDMAQSPAEEADTDSETKLPA